MCSEKETATGMHMQMMLVKQAMLGPVAMAFGQGLSIVALHHGPDDDDDRRTTYAVCIAANEQDPSERIIVGMLVPPSDQARFVEGLGPITNTHVRLLQQEDGHYYAKLLTDEEVAGQESEQPASVEWLRGLLDS